MKHTLKDIRERLRVILSNWTYESETVNEGSTVIVKASGLIGMRTAVNQITDLGLFQQLTKELQKSIIFTTALDRISIQHAEGIRLNNALLSLQTLLVNLHQLLVETVPSEHVDSLNIKLPEVNDFNDLSNAARDIHLALSQVIFNKEINGETKIISVENGSIWFNVFVGAMAVGLIASLAWSAAVVYKKILEGRLLEQQVRGLKVKNDSLEDIVKAQKAETDFLIQAEAEHINSEHFKENLPETIERIKNSLKILSELVSKGAEIHPALVAPENVSNLFPDMRNLVGVESKIKKLTA